MRSKQTIVLVIIVLALGIAGYFAYKAIFAPAAETPATGSTTTTTSVPKPILPHGTTLNFDSVKKFNKNNKIYQYPQVTPGEIGQPLDQLLTK